jgi:hypothetical protein
MAGFLDLLTQSLQKSIDAGTWNDTTNLAPAPPPIESQENRDKADNAYDQEAMANEAKRSMGEDVNPKAPGAQTPLLNRAHLPTQEEFAQMLRMQKVQKVENNIESALNSKFKGEKK